MMALKLDEWIKIYNQVFSMKSGYKRIYDLDKSVRISLITVILIGVSLIVSSIFLQNNLLILSLIYIIFGVGCFITLVIIKYKSKQKYNDVNYLAKEANEQFINDISLTFQYNFRKEKVLNAIIEYLDFQWRKEESKKTFFSNFSLAIKFIAFILPILISYAIAKMDVKIIGMFVLTTTYLLVFVLFLQAVYEEIKNNNSKGNKIKWILEILHEQKIKNLHRSLAEDKVAEILEDRNFKELTPEILIDAEYESVESENLEYYVSALYSIKHDICRDRMQEVINNYNKSLAKS